MFTGDTRMFTVSMAVSRRAGEWLAFERVSRLPEEAALKLPCLVVVCEDFETRENTPNPTQIPKKNTDTNRSGLFNDLLEFQL